MAALKITVRDAGSSRGQHAFLVQDGSTVTLVKANYDGDILEALVIDRTMQQEIKGFFKRGGYTVKVED